MRLAIIIAVSIFLIVGISIAQKDSQQPPDKPKELPKEIIGKDGAPMVLIPAGEFQMGSNDSKHNDWEPVHTVYLDAFYMDKYEVTNAQYRKFVQATGHKEPVGFKWTLVEDKPYMIRLVSGFKPWSDKDFNGDNQSVVCVSWEDARAYAEWAGERLPTEAEWEKSARGGLEGKRYVWGDDWPPPKKSANFCDEMFRKTSVNSYFIAGYDDGYVYTAPVGSFVPNGYGLYDMAGNVSEWCADWYDNGYYRNSPKENPKGPNSGSERVLRGESWCFSFNLSVVDSMGNILQLGHFSGESFNRVLTRPSDGFNLRVASRFDSDPAGTYYNVGFRCVVSATP